MTRGLSELIVNAKATAPVLMERLTQRIAVQRGKRVARLVEVHAIGVAAKLAVVEFGGKTLLLSVTREGVALLATEQLS